MQRASTNSVRMPTWDIQRGGRGATSFSLNCIENEWLGNTHSFVKISGDRSMTLFACHFTRTVLRVQNWFRREHFMKNNVLLHVHNFRKAFRNSSKEDSQEETGYREKHYSRLHKSSATSKSCVVCGAGHETDIYCVLSILDGHDLLHTSCLLLDSNVS